MSFFSIYFQQIMVKPIDSFEMNLVDHSCNYLAPGVEGEEVISPGSM